MTNKSKSLGTEAETAVVRYLVDNGWPNAERRAMRGQFDYGDVTGTPGLCWEVKAGKVAEAAADCDVRAWQDQTDVEKANSKAAVGILVMKRRGKGTANVHQWWAMIRTEDLYRLMNLDDAWPAEGCPTAWVRLTLKEIVRFLHFAGYGTPPTEGIND